MSPPRPANLRAFSVAEFSLVRRALQEIHAARPTGQDTADSVKDSHLIHEKIQEILGSPHTSPCQH